MTSRRASRRHDGRPRAPALNAAATVSPPSHSSPSPRRRVRRTRSPASNAGRPGIRKRRRGCRWTMSSSTRCAAARPTGLASGSICATFPRASARQKIRPNLTMIPGPRRVELGLLGRREIPNSGQPRDPTGPRLFGWEHWRRRTRQCKDAWHPVGPAAQPIIPVRCGEHGRGLAASSRAPSAEREQFRETDKFPNQ